MRKWTYWVSFGPLVSVDEHGSLFEQPALEEWLNGKGVEGWELVKLDHVKPLRQSTLKAAFSSKLQWVGVFKRVAGEVGRP